MTSEEIQALAAKLSTLTADERAEVLRIAGFSLSDDARAFFRLTGAKGGRRMNPKKRKSITENLRKANIARDKYWALVRASGKPLSAKARKGKTLKDVRKGA